MIKLIYEIQNTGKGVITEITPDNLLLLNPENREFPNGLSSGRVTVFHNSVSPEDAALVVKRTGGTDGVTKNLTAIFYNDTDVIGAVDDTQNEVMIALQAGTNDNHRRYFLYRDKDGVNQWINGANAGGTFILYDAASSSHREWLEPTSASGNSYYNSTGTGSFLINMLNDGGSGVGTGGLIIGSGGTSPLQTHKLSGNGRFKFGTNVTDNLNYQGVLEFTCPNITIASQGVISVNAKAEPTANATNQVFGIQSTVTTSTNFTQNSVAGLSGIVKHNGGNTLTTGAAITGLVQIISAQTITNGRIFEANANLATGSTATNMTYFYGGTPTGSGAIVTFTGVRILDATATSQTMAFRGDISSGTGKWNFYVPGTAKNYLNGRTSLGSPVDDTVNQLQVYGDTKLGGGLTINVPITSASAYYIASINQSTGKFEKLLDTSIAKVIDDTTSTTYTSATISAAYPSATNGQMVLCTNQSRIYTKTNGVWHYSPLTIL